MEAKDKANELVDKFTVVGLQQRNEGIQCASICVDELIQLSSELNKWNMLYFEQVKKEIENL